MDYFIFGECMSCFIDFIDINLWEDKVREIHLDKSRLKRKFYKNMLLNTGTQTSASTLTMAFQERPSIGLVSRK
jgi:hypothetical protein